MKGRLSGGYDIILLLTASPDRSKSGKPGKLSDALSDRASQLEFLFSKAGLLK
jgi:hypothetical protein